MARQSAPVLVTRPQAEGEAFAAALVQRFGDRVQPLIAPLIAPRFLAPQVPPLNYAAVIFTSAQAVEGARRLGVRLPALAWCVGRKTAETAAAAGFQSRSADGDAKSLAEAILADPPMGRILYLRGVDTRGNILEIIENSGINVDVAIVYAQEAQPLSQEALHLLTTPSDVIVPVFSPRTASLFRQALPADTVARLHLLAMSAAVADALRDIPHAALLIADRPDSPAMLDGVESLLAALAPP